MNKLIAIDPGSLESGVCVVESTTYKPIWSGKINNQTILDEFQLPADRKEVRVVIEMIAHYGTGMPAGKTVFDTCVWIGRFMEWFVEKGVAVELLPRATVKMELCGTHKAKDSNIIQALIDRFAPNKSNRGKGTKKEPGFFYGFRADIWQAYALGVAYLDINK